MDALWPHKWWSTLKSSVFGSSSDSSLPPLLGGGEVVVLSGLWVGREGRNDVVPFLLVDGKHYWDPIYIDLPSTCHQSPSLTTFTFRSWEVRHSCWIWIPMVAMTHWVCFLFFWWGQLMFWPLISLWHFGCSFVWVALLFAGEWLISPQFQRVHFLLSSQLQTDKSI